MGLVTAINQLPNDETGNEVWEIQTLKGTFRFVITSEELQSALARRSYLLGEDSDETVRMKILVNKTLTQLLLPTI